MAGMQMIERRERIERLQFRLRAIGLRHARDDRRRIFGDVAVCVDDLPLFSCHHGYTSYRLQTTFLLPAGREGKIPVFFLR